MGFLASAAGTEVAASPAPVARRLERVVDAARARVEAVLRWVNQSLARRFVSLSLALLLVIQFTTFLVMHASLQRQARSALPEQLAMGTGTTLSMLDWRSQRLIEGARLLASDYGFRTAVQSEDRETIASVLSNHGARIGASEVAFLGTDLKLIATAEETPAGSMVTGPTLAHLAATAEKAGGAGAIAVVRGSIRQVVLVPMKAPRLVGWVLMYFAINDDMAEKIHQLCVADLTVLVRQRAGDPWTVAISRLEPTMSRALAALPDAYPDLIGHPLLDHEVQGHRLGIAALALDAANAEADGTRPQVLALLSVSVDQAMEAPRDLQLSLIAATLLGFVTFGVAIAWMARRVTTPLESLATAAERLGSGDATTTIEGLQGRDEVGELARAFEAMRGVLAAKQAQIVQSEKLASIGQLAAGVAHEINNPIGFVFSNFTTLESYLALLFRMLAAYQEEEAGLAGTPAAQRLARLREEIELDYLAEDIPALMSESKDGVQRVRKIVQDLKDFSHVDAQREWKVVDLHVGLDSTLNIVSNEIKYKADVVKAYGELPEVECLPHELNQVFMNLLVNAAHAVGPARGTITLRTGTQGQEAWVEVQDDGSGIAPADLKRIFDPFFTTKPVGKGTGLGLSLAYGIVQAHGGRIEVDTEIGRGTTFRITLPLRRSAAAADAPPARESAP